MGKAGRWLRSFLSGKKDRPPQAAEASTPVPHKDKRWSFRRPPVQDGRPAEAAPATGRSGPNQDQDQDALGLAASGGADFDQNKRAVAVAVASAAAADAAVARLSSSRGRVPAAGLVEDAAAVRIQATFRGYLARTALCALRGIVKLQALVRGQLVRKQANATLRCMQALLAAQSQLRARRVLALHVQDHHHLPPPPRPRHSSPQHPRHRRSYEMDRSCEDNAKIVEVDVGEPVPRGAGGKDRQLVADYHHARSSPAPSGLTELSPRGHSVHFDEFSVATAQSSPRHASEACPSYMANTESSRAKARSQSAPRQRTDALERQPSRRKQGTPPRGAKMQRSSSLAGAGAAPRGGGGGHHWSPWSSGVRLDVSTASLQDSECGSTSSVLTPATVYSRTRSLVGFEVRRGQY